MGRAAKTRWTRMVGFAKRVRTAATPGRVFAFVSVILIPVVGVYVASADSDLMLVDDAEISQRDLKGAEHAAITPQMITDSSGRVVGGSALLAVNCSFKNRGFKAGHIDRVELRTFPPSDNVKMIVHYVDRSVLRWREKKRLRFEFIGMMKWPSNYTYFVSFIDDSGREVGKMDLKFTILLRPFAQPGVVLGEEFVP
jgi:hypothetical protein